MIQERLRSYFENRLPRGDSWSLTQSNIYILPTRAGWAFAMTLLVMLLASINYQLNLGYVLTFLLCGAGLAGMQQTHGNLRGMTLRVRSPQPVFAGEPAAVDIVLDNPGRERNGIGLGIYRADHRAKAWVDAPAHGTGAARLSFVPPQRGRHVLPTILVETNFPLGLFRAWTVWRPAAQVLVYPMLDDRSALRDHGIRGRFLWTPASNKFGWTSYLGREPRESDAPEYAAAARREDLSGLAPAWVGVGELDLFHDESVDYAQRLQAAGVPCELVTVPGMYHAADGLAMKAPAMQAFRRGSLDHLRTYL